MYYFRHFPGAIPDASASFRVPLQLLLRGFATERRVRRRSPSARRGLPVACTRPAHVLLRHFGSVTRSSLYTFFNRFFISYVNGTKVIFLFTYCFQPLNLEKNRQLSKKIFFEDVLCLEVGSFGAYFYCISSFSIERNSNTH